MPETPHNPIEYDPTADHSGLIVVLAHEFARLHNIEHEEAMSAISTNVTKALRHYKPDRGATVATFMKRCIERGAHESHIIHNVRGGLDTRTRKGLHEHQMLPHSELFDSEDHYDTRFHDDWHEAKHLSRCDPLASGRESPEPMETRELIDAITAAADRSMPAAIFNTVVQRNQITASRRFGIGSNRLRDAYRDATQRVRDEMENNAMAGMDSREIIERELELMSERKRLADAALDRQILLNDDLVTVLAEAAKQLEPHDPDKADAIRDWLDTNGYQKGQ